MPADGAQSLRLEESEQDGYPVLTPAGEVDISTVETLRDRLGGWLDEGKLRLVVDLGQLDYLDSTGLGCVAAARKKAQDLGGDLVLVCTRPRILRLFTITGLDAVFTICDSVAAAAAKLKAGEA